MSTVFVSGANGYIAQHLVVQLLKKGYSVVGSVRSKEKGDKMVANLKSDKFEYVIVSDFTKEGAFDEAVKAHPAIVAFFHTASPVVFDIKSFEDDVIKPAIKGTESALKAAKKYGRGIKRFVYTSSFAAILSAEQTKDSVLTEETWNQISRNGAKDPMSAYRVSKTYAEKAVWKFAENESPQFTINVVNPTMVFGPQAFDSEVKGTLNFSAEIVNSLLKLKPKDPMPTMFGGFIDVRDIARAHIFAFETEITNFRFMCCEERYTSQLVLDLIHKNFPQLSHLPVGKPGTGSDFSEMWKIDNSKTKKLIGPFIDLETSVIDTVNQILDNE